MSKQNTSFASESQNRNSRCNLVIYCTHECKQGTPWFTRFTIELEKVTTTLQVSGS